MFVGHSMLCFWLRQKMVLGVGYYHRKKPNICHIGLADGWQRYENEHLRLGNVNSCYKKEKYLVKFFSVTNGVLDLLGNIERKKLSNVCYKLFGRVWQGITRRGEIRKELSRNERE